MFVRTVARPLLASWFVYAAVDALLDPSRHAAKSAPFVEPYLEEAGIPLTVPQLIRIHAAATLGAATALALSRTPRTSGLALASLAAVTAATSEQFWREDDEDPARREPRELHQEPFAPRRRPHRRDGGQAPPAVIVKEARGEGPRVPRASRVSPTVGSPGAGPGQLWDAPLATGPLDATVDVPGSKSLTNRFLILAALASGPVRIHGGLHSRDSHLMIDALRLLGVEIDDADDVWTITPPERLTGGAFIECGLAGTVMRFVPPLVLLADGEVSFDGDAGARGRPMGAMIDALRALGAEVDDADTGALPFSVSPPADVAPVVAIDASASSQFVSGLLLVAARLPKGLTVRHVGATLPSLPHIDMTCAALRSAGVEVAQPDERTWEVSPGEIRLGDVRVEPDLSNAGPFIAAALVAGGTVRIPHWPSETTQPGALYPELLREMGATCTLTDGVMSVTGAGSIHGIDADLSPAGEITPTIAALCALADGPSNLMGIGHLRGHETDRLAALATEIRRFGGRCDEGPASLHISPPAGGSLHGVDVQTYHDHRMATFGAIVGLGVPGTRVVNVGTTAKTMPEFPEMWREMLGLPAEAPTP